MLNVIGDMIGMGTSAGCFYGVVDEESRKNSWGSNVFFIFLRLESGYIWINRLLTSSFGTFFL